MNVTDAHSTRRHMTALIEYAKALRISIQNINENSYNNFMMRIGKWLIFDKILPSNRTQWQRHIAGNLSAKQCEMS